MSAVTRDVARERFEDAAAELVRQMLTLKQIEVSRREQCMRVDEALRVAAAQLAALNELEDDPRVRDVKSTERSP